MHSPYSCSMRGLQSANDHVSACSNIGTRAYSGLVMSYLNFTSFIPLVINTSFVITILITMPGVVKDLIKPYDSLTD